MQANFNNNNGEQEMKLFMNKIKGDQGHKSNDRLEKPKFMGDKRSEKLSKNENIQHDFEDFKTVISSLKPITEA